MTVDAGTIVWLKEGALYSSSTDAGVGAAWGAQASDTEIISTLALAADAITEAGRQQTFMEGPHVIETVNVKGLKAGLVGQPVTITASRLGYDAGVVVFVLGAEESSEIERTILTVLRKLT